MKIDGLKIKRARQLLALSQLDLAHAANITMATLSKIENGHELYPSMRTIAAIASAFKCDPKLLIAQDMNLDTTNDKLIRGA